MSVSDVELSAVISGCFMLVNTGLLVWLTRERRREAHEFEEHQEHQVHEQHEHEERELRQFERMMGPGIKKPPLPKPEPPPPKPEDDDQ